MAKKKETVEEAPVSGVTVSPLMGALLLGHESKFAKADAFIGESQDKYVVVMPGCPLAYQYLLGISGEPLRQLIFIGGPPKSYKTSLMLYMAKRVLSLGPGLGDSYVINTEHKWSSSKARAVLGLDDYKRSVMINAESINQWQSKAKQAIDIWLEGCKKAKKADKLPVLFLGIDSLCGSQTDYIAGRVEKDGYGSKTFNDRAQMIYQWIQTQHAKIMRAPVLIVITNHETDKTNSMGHVPQKITSGGNAAGFHCSIDIRMRKVGTVKKVGVTGHKLRLRTYHNSLGPSPRTVEVPYYEVIDEMGIQHDQFDWDDALIDLLLGQMADNAKMKDAIKGVLGTLVEYSKPGVGKCYSCERFNVDKQKALDDVVTAAVMGKLIQADPQIVSELQRVLGIDVKDEWEPTLRFH